MAIFTILWLNTFKSIKLFFQIDLVIDYANNVK